MRIKTYVFDDVKEGMKKIKEEHGVDTIIVDIKNNGATGAKKGCEISVAVEGERARQGDDLGGPPEASGKCVGLCRAVRERQNKATWGWSLPVTE